jgi:WD40 repeat protein
MPFRRGVFTADAARLLTTHDDNVVRSWDVRTGRLLAQLQGASGGVTRLRLLADDRLLLAASHDGTTRLWNVADGSLVRTFEGAPVEASDAVFAKGHVTVIDSEGRVTLHRCDACLSDQALIARARGRLRTLESLPPPR